MCSDALAPGRVVWGRKLFASLAARMRWLISSLRYLTRRRRSNLSSGSDGCFSFPDARYLNAAEAFPLIELDAVGYVGTNQANASSFREVALDVARNKLNAVGVQGAVTSKGSVSIKGTVTVSGDNYDETGTSGGTAGAGW